MTSYYSVGRSLTFEASAATRVRLAAGRVYEHEVALHAARQSGVDLWICAAADRLHNAILEYDAALAAASEHPFVADEAQQPPHCEVYSDRWAVLGSNGRRSSRSGPAPRNRVENCDITPVPTGDQSPRKVAWRRESSPLEGIDAALVQDLMAKLNRT